MATRKGWLTPESGATEYECRPVFIPLDDDLSYMAAVNGALNDLTKAENWEQFGSVTPEEAAEVMLEMYTRYTEEECCEDPPVCPPPEMTIGDPELGYEGPLRIIRRGAGGHTEVLEDDGTWAPPTGDLEPPPVPARTGGTLEDRLCLAAANAANVLADLYEEVTDQVQISVAPAAVFGVIYDYVIGILGFFAGPTAAAYASLGKVFFDAFIETADTLGSDVWDSEFTEELRCFMLAYAQDDGSGVITFEWPVMRRAISDAFLDAGAELDVDRALLWGQVGYLFDLLAADGIDIAGATTAITVPDCGCEFDWCTLLTTATQYTTELVAVNPSWPITTSFNNIIGVNPVDADLGAHINVKKTFTAQYLYEVTFNYSISQASGTFARRVWLRAYLGGVLKVEAIGDNPSPVGGFTISPNQMIDRIEMQIWRYSSASGGAAGDSIAMYNIKVRGRSEESPFLTGGC